MRRNNKRKYILLMQSLFGCVIIIIDIFIESRGENYAQKDTHC